MSSLPCPTYSGLVLTNCELRSGTWPTLLPSSSLLSSGYSVTDECTRVWIDEREVISAQSGSCVYSVASTAWLQALGDEAEPVVLVDMHDYLLKGDVAGLV